MTEAGTSIFVFSRMLVFHEVKLQEKPRLARGIINLATFFFRPGSAIKRFVIHSSIPLYHALNPYVLPELSLVNFTYSLLEELVMGAGRELPLNRPIRGANGESPSYAVK